MSSSFSIPPRSHPSSLSVDCGIRRASSYLASSSRWALHSIYAVLSLMVKECACPCIAGMTGGRYVGKQERCLSGRGWRNKCQERKRQKIPRIDSAAYKLQLTRTCGYSACSTASSLSPAKPIVSSCWLSILHRGLRAATSFTISSRMLSNDTLI